MFQNLTTSFCALAESNFNVFQVKAQNSTWNINLKKKKSISLADTIPQ